MRTLTRQPPQISGVEAGSRSGSNPSGYPGQNGGFSDGFLTKRRVEACPSGQPEISGDPKNPMKSIDYPPSEGYPGHPPPASKSSSFRHLKLALRRQCLEQTPALLVVVAPWEAQESLPFPTAQFQPAQLFAQYDEQNSTKRKRDYWKLAYGRRSGC